LAGYIGHDSLWSQFNERWTHLLLRHGMREVHMRRWSGEREKRGWTVAQANDVLGEFVQCIRDCQLIGLGIAVDADAWRALDSDKRKRFGNAQQFCFQRIMRRIMDLVSKSDEREIIDVVFDQDFEFAKQRLGLVDSLFKFDRMLGKQVGSICFANTRYHFALQAADFLAWVTRRQLAEQIEGKASPRGWNMLFADLPYGFLDYRGEHWDQDRINRRLPEALADLEKNLRIEQAQVALEEARGL